MKILVCVKQVPDMESQFRSNSRGNWFEESDLSFRMNEYDEYAVEEAVRVKEQLGGAADITVLSVGPERVLEVLKKALALGCDRSVHILDKANQSRDPWQISSFIAAFARDKGYELIFSGMQSQDRGSAQVGITVAELLGIPCTTNVVSFVYDGGVITVRRELESGIKGVVKMKSPALVTCQSGLNAPRYPTLPCIIKAKKKEMITILAPDLPQEPELTGTVAVYPPTGRGKGIVLEGDVAEIADRLVKILKERTATFR